MSLIFGSISLIKNFLTRRNGESLFKDEIMVSDQDQQKHVELIEQRIPKVFIIFYSADQL